MLETVKDREEIFLSIIHIINSHSKYEVPYKEQLSRVEDIFMCKFFIVNVYEKNNEDIRPLSCEEKEKL